MHNLIQSSNNIDNFLNINTNINNIQQNTIWKSPTQKQQDKIDEFEKKFLQAQKKWGNNSPIYLQPNPQYPSFNPNPPQPPQYWPFNPNQRPITEKMPEEFLTETFSVDFDLKQISWFTIEQISWFTIEQISAFTKEQISAFTKEQISAFTKEQIQAFTKEQIQAFTKEQISAFTKEQILAFTKEQNEIFTRKQFQTDNTSFFKSSIFNLTSIGLLTLSVFVLGLGGGVSLYYYLKKRNNTDNDLSNKERLLLENIFNPEFQEIYKARKKNNENKEQKTCHVNINEINSTFLLNQPSTSGNNSKTTQM